MSRISISGKLKVSLVVFLLVLVVVGIFPGAGGEGAQREIPALNEKRDWWNFSTAALYGLWPDGFFPWTFSLTIAQLMIYAVGVWLMSRELQLSQNRRVFNFLTIIGGVFAFQLWRDATLLAIETLSLGLLIGVKATFSARQVIRFLLAFLTSITGCLFKPIFAPLVLLVFFLILISKIRNRKLLVVFSIIALSLSVIPFGIDKILSNNFHLKKSYPEQQVFIYDLSKLYCWGYSADVTSTAKTLLSGILAIKNDYESICASLSPTGWDSLHVQIPEVKSSPALRTIGEGEEKSLNDLKTGWIKTILSHPMDWLMTKSSDAIQVLFMANAFYMPGLYVDSHDLTTSLGDQIIKIILIPFHILDKIRIFSIAFTLLFGLVMVYRNRASTQFSKSKEQILFKFLAVNLLVASFATIAFIANNGRYVLPYILLSYFFLIISLDREKIKFL
jgi:uncharacterized membrane protein